MGSIHQLLLSDKFEHIRIISGIVLLSSIFVNRNVTSSIFCPSDAIKWFKTAVDCIIELFLRVDEIKGRLIEFTCFSHDGGSPSIFTLLHSQEICIIFVKVLLICHSFRELGHVLVLQIMNILFELILWRSIDLSSTQSLNFSLGISFHQIGIATDLAARHHSGLIRKVHGKDVALEVTNDATLLISSFKMSMAFATPIIYGSFHIKMWKTILLKVAQEHEILITNVLLRLLEASILLNTIILVDTLDALVGQDLFALVLRIWAHCSRHIIEVGILMLYW